MHILHSSSVEGSCELLVTLDDVTFDRHASQHEKIFLRAIVAEFQRTGLEEAVFARVYQRHVEICRRLEGTFSHTYSSTSTCTSSVQ